MRQRDRVERRDAGTTQHGNDDARPDRASSDPPPSTGGRPLVREAHDRVALPHVEKPDLEDRLERDDQRLSRAQGTAARKGAAEITAATATRRTPPGARAAVKRPTSKQNRQATFAQATGATTRRRRRRAPTHHDVATSAPAAAPRTAAAPSRRAPSGASASRPGHDEVREHAERRDRSEAGNGRPRGDARRERCDHSAGGGRRRVPASSKDRASSHPTPCATRPSDDQQHQTRDRVTNDSWNDGSSATPDRARTERSLPPSAVPARRAAAGPTPPSDNAAMTRKVRVATAPPLSSAWSDAGSGATSAAAARREPARRTTATMIVARGEAHRRDPPRCAAPTRTSTCCRARARTHDGEPAESRLIAVDHAASTARARQLSDTAPLERCRDHDASPSRARHRDRPTAARRRRLQLAVAACRSGGDHAPAAISHARNRPLR